MSSQLGAGCGSGVATAASYAAALDVWSRLVPAGLDRTILPGDHYSLLRRPEVERLARELTAQLVQRSLARGS